MEPQANKKSPRGLARHQPNPISSHVPVPGFPGVSLVSSPSFRIPEFPIRSVQLLKLHQGFIGVLLNHWVSGLVPHLGHVAYSSVQTD